MIAPAGMYIDMFSRVVRVNDFNLRDANTTGRKTTDVIIHQALRDLMVVITFDRI